MLWRIRTHLEVESAGLGGVLELGTIHRMVSGALNYRGPTQTGIGRPHLEKLIVAWGLGQLLAVVDGLLERVGLGGDHICGLMRCLVRS
jgi:hypothetical protein